MMGSDELRAWYGEAHVFKAAERGAVSTLLISDALFKCVFTIHLSCTLLNVGQVERFLKTEEIRETC